MHGAVKMNKETAELNELNSYEVLSIAVQVERKGVEFYLNAAQVFNGSELSGLFEKLVQWEQAHIDSFIKMRDKHTQESWDKGAYNPVRVNIPKSRMMAGLSVFGISSDLDRKFTGNETREEVLKVAIKNEKDAVVFYTGLKAFVVDSGDLVTVDEIIKEEMHHVRVLSQALEQV
jgi:rubrerythrin